MENTFDHLDDRFDRPLRPLLPATRRLPGKEAVQTKRLRVSVACSACRTRKIKCSAEHPKCSECVLRNVSCEYADTQKSSLRRKYKDLRIQQDMYQDLVNQLVTLPENESFDMLRRIRADHNIERLLTQPDHDTSSADTRREYHNALMRKNEELEKKSQDLVHLYDILQHAPQHGAKELFRHIRQGMSLDNALALSEQHLVYKCPSANETNRSILPQTSTSIEFQLAALHPNAYPALVPLDVASIDLGLLGISPLASLRFGKPDLPAKKRKRDSVSEQDHQLLCTPSSTSGRASADPEAEISSEYADTRLNCLRICRWTDVIISDDLAARAISLHLVNEMPWWAYFDIDLFLEDLVNGEVQFCSRLLVNSVLAWACQMYAYYEPAAYSLAHSFLHEASQLYDAVKDVDCLTTLASISLMCMAWTTFGNDKIGMKLLAESASMAQRLHLYNVPADTSSSPLDLQASNIKIAASATAWGSFNYQMLVSMSYHRKSFVKIPPNLPIPGDSSAEDSINQPLPLYQSQAYTFICKLWLIAFEMNYQYFHEGVVLLPAAEIIFQKLLAWADGLRDDTKRGEYTPDGVVNLHISFHTIVLDLFRPFADVKPQPKLSTFANNNATPIEIIEASMKQLKRLVYTYRATSKSANCSIIWQSGMLYVINHILHNYTDKEAHFYFLLCMRGYQNLARTIPWIGGLVQGIAAMAVRLGAILPKDALDFIEEIKSEGEHIQEYRSAYPVDFHPSTAEQDAATLEHLVHEFRNLKETGRENTEVPEGWKGDSVALFTTLAEGEDEGDLIGNLAS